ncbi:MAG: glycerophosphodiester phosphodiesterase family protein [Pseudomonadota bacterium]
MLPTAFLTHPIAHRGLHDVSKGVPENSRAAVQAAIDHGYGIEIDIQCTSDQAAIVFHDDTLDRLTADTGRVSRRTRADLATQRLTGSDETIPDLPEILAMVDGRVPLLVEVKDQDGALGENVGALEAEIARNLDGYQGAVAVMSFNPHSVSALQTLAPQVPRGLVTDGFDAAEWDVAEARRDELAGISHFDRVGASFISHNHKRLEAKAVADLKARAVPILCWTIRSIAEEHAARRIADNITFEGYLATTPT